MDTGSQPALTGWLSVEHYCKRLLAEFFQPSNANSKIEDRQSAPLQGPTRRFGRAYLAIHAIWWYFDLHRKPCSCIVNVGVWFAILPCQCNLGHDGKPWPTQDPLPRGASDRSIPNTLVECWSMQCNSRT
jgi:hypothetical protein